METIQKLNKIASYLFLEFRDNYKEDRLTADNYETALQLVEEIIRDSTKNIDSAYLSPCYATCAAYVVANT